MKMRRSWRSPRLLRIALALLRPHPKKKRTWGDTPHAPRQLLHFPSEDAQDMTFDWLRTSPAGALDGTG
jgi:hypothetical protein